jgi:hypothetical protein
MSRHFGFGPLGDKGIAGFLTTIHGKRPFDQEGSDQIEGWAGGSCRLSRHHFLPSLGGQLGIRGANLAALAIDVPGC